MKFIWRYLFKKMHEIGNEPEPYERSMLASPKLSVATSSDDWGDGLNIGVHNAKGGKIVTFRKYDRKSDRHNHTVYIIHDELDFEKELGKIITLESLR